ncbi:MAG: prolipoprotein diacylglyceryl transferase [Chloroflexota bacterium]|nr:prolipoprotein diacylglyceryl transferase [Chloroflexota bacterium]
MFIDPIALHLGPIEVHWYGIIIATAVLAGALLGTVEVRRRGEDVEQGWSMLLVAILTSVIGARIYHVIHEWGPIYSKDPWLIPQIWNGGIGIPGAIIGGAIGIWWYTRRNRLVFGRWLDIFAPALLLGQAIGRLGNFVNQELYGPPTSQCGTGGFPACLPFGIQIDAAHRVPPWDPVSFPVGTTTFVPLFAYEAVLNLVGMAILLVVARRFAPRLFDGDIALLYLVWYGWVRSFLETYRTQNWYIGPLPTATWLGVAGVILAGGFLLLRHLRGWGTPGAWMHRPEGENGAGDVDGTAQPGAPPTSEPSPG